MYTYVAKNLITVAIYKCVHKSLRLSQRDIKIPLSSYVLQFLLLHGGEKFSPFFLTYSVALGFYLTSTRSSQTYQVYNKIPFARMIKQLWRI